MAVYTDVSDDVLRQYLTAYDLGSLLSCKGIAEGVENSNFLLRTTAGQFILTLYEKRVAASDLPFFIGLLDHLAGSGFNCPQPVRMKNGEALGRLEGRPAAIVTFLDGMGVSHPEPDHCHQAGETLAQLHDKAADMDLSRRNALDPKGWRDLIDANLARADEVEPGLAQMIRSQFDACQREWPSDLPRGVIHGDFFKDNVFFLDGRLTGVIDFYFACNDLLAYDLAIAINAWCFRDDLSFDRDLSAALIAGYQSRRPLDDGEKDALPLLVRGAALRFLLTRLNDWLNVPEGALVLPHDPRAFSARLRHHIRHGNLAHYGAGR